MNGRRVVIDTREVLSFRQENSCRFADQLRGHVYDWEILIVKDKAMPDLFPLCPLKLKQSSLVSPPSLPLCSVGGVVSGHRLVS